MRCSSRRGMRCSWPRSGVRPESCSGRPSAARSSASSPDTTAHAGAPRLRNERSSKPRMQASRQPLHCPGVGDELLAGRAARGATRSAPAAGVAAMPARAARATARAGPQASRCTRLRALARGQPSSGDHPHHRILVAALQPRQLHRRRRRHQSQPHARAQLVGQALGQCQTPAHPALVPAQHHRDLRLTEPLLPVQRAHQPRLFELAQPGCRHCSTTAAPWRRPHRARAPRPAAGDHDSSRAARTRLRPSNTSRLAPTRYACTGVSCPRRDIDSCISCCACGAHNRIDAKRFAQLARCQLQGRCRLARHAGAPMLPARPKTQIGR